MSEAIGRNDPCPCGSGKKYKTCCAGKTRWTGARVAGMRAPTFIALLAGVVVVIVLVAMYGPNARRGPGGATRPAVPLSAAPLGEAPAPWTYDSTSNQHWDPGHNHWHPGPPPPESERAAAGGTPGAAPGPLPGAGAPAAGAAGATPAPYQYDPATNRHWDPTHGHWHDGPPPATPTR